MKKLIVLLLGISLLAACNNKKEKDRAGDPRDKDDYGADSRKGEDKDDSRNTDFTESEGWSAADIRRFNTECEKSLDGNEEMISKFCPCVLEKMQKRFTSFADANTVGTEAEGEKMAKDCIADLGLDKSNSNRNTDFNTGGGSWSSAEVNAFVSNCVSEAVKGGMGRGQANSYCSCMQEKFEQLFPNASDAGALTNEDLQSPSMKRLIQGCLE